MNDSKDNSMLYFAYGMNTNRQGMAYRCPGARPLGAATLLNHRFRFAGPADVQGDHRSQVHGVLWLITDQCLASLDILEGYPGFYGRKWAYVRYQDTEIKALVYYMQPGNKDHAPSPGYFDMVLTGYRDFGVPETQLHNTMVKYHKRHNMQGTYHEMVCRSH